MTVKNIDGKSLKSWLIKINAVQYISKHSYYLYEKHLVMHTQHVFVSPTHYVFSVYFQKSIL